MKLVKHPNFYVFDIDGTILTKDHQVLSSTKLALAKIKERGFSTMLASARPPLAITPIIENLAMESFYISLNGALVIRDQEILLDEPMGQEATQEVVTRALSRGLSVNVYSTWDWFIQDVNPHSTREGEIVGFHGSVRDLSTVSKAHKILVIGEPSEIESLQKELTNEVQAVQASLSNPTYLEVVATGVSKAHALELVCELVGVPLSQTAVFGDGENDLPMLQVAGLGVAMGNAHQSLKNVAHFVTGTNNEDGILQAIQEILHI